MAIKTFKDVIGNQGYRVDKKDREIFEREVRKGLFGNDGSDIIEFVLYDASENALPQEASNGKLVRYISITEPNIKKYFSKTDQTKFNIKSNKADEFYVNVELLIREAGYTNGIFKSSVSLLNRRLGSEDRKFDKAWIHEISPSRTEIRVLPVIEDNTGKPNSDLSLRYNIFTEGKDFASDIMGFLDEFTAQFDVASIITKMLTLRGNIADGTGYVELIEKEFKIDNFERWLSLVKISFDKSLQNFRTNRYYNILEGAKFGQLTGEQTGLDFDGASAMDMLCDMAENCVNYHLPNQDLRNETTRTKTQQKTLDAVKNILRTVSSNEDFTAESPVTKAAGIRGCTDSNATNYNPLATVADICNYSKQVTKYRKVPIPPPIPPPTPPTPPYIPPTPRPQPVKRRGCTDSSATNYDSNAQVNDGSCQYPTPQPAKVRGCTDSTATNYNPSAEIDDNSCKYKPVEIKVIPQVILHAPYGSNRTETCINNHPQFDKTVRMSDGKGGFTSFDTPDKAKCNKRPPSETYGGSGGGCLAGNTMVELSNGTSIPIKDIKIGATLKGFDIKTISPWNKVEDNWKGSNIEQYDYDDYQVTDTMEITDAEVYSINNGLLEASEDHKHLVRRNDLWMIRTTLQLKPADVYMDRDKNEIKIHTIVWDRKDTVYLISLNGKHTYFANNILTHNNKARQFDSVGGFETSSFFEYMGQ